MKKRTIENRLSQTAIKLEEKVEAKTIDQVIAGELKAPQKYRHLQ